MRDIRRVTFPKLLLPSDETETGAFCPTTTVFLGGKSLISLVGVRGFEPPAPASRTQCSTRLSYTPTKGPRLASSRLRGKGLKTGT